MTQRLRSTKGIIPFKELIDKGKLFMVFKKSASYDPYVKLSINGKLSRYPKEELVSVSQDVWSNCKFLAETFPHKAKDYDFASTEYDITPELKDVKLPGH